MIDTIHRELGTIEAVGATWARAAHSCTATHQALTGWSSEGSSCPNTYLGNYRQAFTDAALVQAAFALRDAKLATRP
jgi:hypothetical protein